MPCLGVVGRHSKPLLIAAVKFVEKMRVYPDTGGNDEIARARLTLEVQTRHSAEGNASRGGGERRLRRPGHIYWNFQVVCQSVGRANRQDAQCDWQSCQDLRDVMDCPIAATSKDCVVVRRDHLPGDLAGM